jgi:hypothetical protein
LSHCRGELVALPSREDFKNVNRKVVGASVELSAFTQSSFGKVCAPHSAVLLGGIDRYEALFLQGAHDAGEVTGIKAQARPKRPQFLAIRANLPNQPGFIHRAFPVKEAIVHGTDSFGDRSIETPNL